MASPTITNNDRSGALINGRKFQNDVVVFAGATTKPEGMILARDSVSGKLVDFVKGGSTNENGIPKTVLTYDITETGAGDVVVRVPTHADFRKGKLVIIADGDDTNVDNAVRDQLRDYNRVVQDVTDLIELDNQIRRHCYE